MLYKLHNQKQVACRVMQRLETKLYSFLQLDKLVNLSSYKTKIYFFKIIYHLLKKGNLITIFHKYNVFFYAGPPNDGFLLNTLKLKTF